MMIPGWHVEEIERVNRARWMALRQEDLCASEAGALFEDPATGRASHKYTTRRRIAVCKAFGEPAEQNADMRRGKIMEPAVAEAIAVDCGWEPWRCSTYLRARADDPLVRMGASRDYVMSAPLAELLTHPKTRATAEAAGWADLDDRDLVAVRPGELRLVVECKSLDQQVFEREWADGPPAYTVVQAAYQALLDGADGALVACLIENRSKDLHLYAIPRNADFEARLIDEVREFWRAYEAGEEAPVVALDNAYMTDYYPASRDEEVVNLSNEAATWQALVVEREVLKLQQETAQERIDEIEARLKDKMREASKAILPGWSITWRSNARARPLKIARRSEAPRSRR